MSFRPSDPPDDPPDRPRARPASRPRPPRTTPAAIVERVRRLAAREEGLFRVHRTHPALYAAARRAFGSWRAAVAAAGHDYAAVVLRARRMSVDRRGRRRR